MYPHNKTWVKGKVSWKLNLHNVQEMIIRSVRHWGEHTCVNFLISHSFLLLWIPVLLFHDLVELLKNQTKLLAFFSFFPPNFFPTSDLPLCKSGLFPHSLHSPVSIFSLGWGRGMKLSSSSLPSEKFIWQVNEFPLFPRAAHKEEVSSPKGSECEVIARALFF